MKSTKTIFLFLLSAMLYSNCNDLDVDNDLKTIEIKFFEEEFEKIKEKRKKAIEIGVLLTTNDDYVGSGIKIGDKFVKSEIRLKGDWTDHLKHKNKWSYRLKIGKGQTINGMRKISLQHPVTRNYIYEWAFHKMLEDFGLVSLRYDFVNLILNVEGERKNLGIFALEEAFDKRLIENNKRRAGVILKFSEDDLWKDRAAARVEKRAEKSFEEMYLNAPIVAFNESKVYEDSTLVKQFRNAQNLLDAYRKKTKKSYEVFDLDKMGRFMAVVNLLGGSHALIWHNVRFYYNPITALIEPVGFDANGGNEIKYVEENHTLVSDSSFLPYFNKYLNIVQQDSFTNYFLSKHEKEMNRFIKVISSEFKNVEFNLNIIRHNRNTIRKYLTEINQNDNSNEKLFYKEQLELLRKFKFLYFTENKSEIVFKEGNWNLSEPLIIPKRLKVTVNAGFNLNIDNGAEIISESPMFFEGTKEKPIVIFSSSKTGEGLLIKNCKETSKFNFVVFNNLSNIKSKNWETTGCVTIYQSPVQFNNVTFSNNISEDALNIFDAEVYLTNCSFLNTFSDAFDGDFITGKIESVLFSNLGNDAIDISGSNIAIENIEVRNALDKGISVGERSQLTGKNILISSSELAVASKDMSIVKIDSIVVDSCKVGFTAFQKKAEFDKATISTINTKVINTGIVHLVDQNSILEINGEIMPTTEKVKDRFYGNEFGKSSK